MGPNTAAWLALMLIMAIIPIQAYFLDLDDVRGAFVVVADVVLLIYIWLWISWDVSSASGPPIGFVGF